jgi:SAM-dependent methyltransferase
VAASLGRQDGHRDGHEEDPGTVTKRTTTSVIPWAGAQDDPWLGSTRLVPVRPHFRRWLASHADGPVLEIGPGLRPTASIAGSHFIDRSAHVLGLLEAKGAHVSVAADTLPFPDGHLGAALAFEVFEHVHDDDSLFREVARALRPGGVLLLSVPIRASMWIPLDDACGHVRRYEPEELFAKAKSFGFEVRGYAWSKAVPLALSNLQAKVLHAGRPIATTFVQHLVFPVIAAWDARFGSVEWTSPDTPVPSAAEHLAVWLVKTGEVAGPA